jgi:hypothetical protein
MSRLLAAGLTALLMAGMPQEVSAQPASPLGIAWEVKSRFRLFRAESDFLQHVAADRADGVLAAERRLAHSSDGRGWARLLVNSLCVDAGGTVLDTCDRDGVQESYLAPRDHQIGVIATGAPAGAVCAWTFEQVNAPPQSVSAPCEEEVRLRVQYGTPAFATAVLEGGGERVSAEIMVRDLLIAGLGDSFASGEGNPDRPIALDDSGFCFRRLMGGGENEFFRPGRAGYKGDKSCDLAARDARASTNWAQFGANWMSAACHRSLYSYQLRTALALAVENRHIAVTFVPLACTGADIASGMFGTRRAREVTCGGRGRRGSCPRSVPGQIPQMQAVLEKARRGRRGFDLVLLTIGGNDVGFSRLVSNVLLEDSTERAVFRRSGDIITVDEARASLMTKLPTDFAKLRAALKPMVGGDLGRVLYVTYANPALHNGGKDCPSGRHGVDIHPAFSVDSERLTEATTFVEREFMPVLRSLALCEGGAICTGPTDRMTFVDQHQHAFHSRGFCAQGSHDPAFDRACFAADGTSFHTDPVAASQQPLVCGASVREFRPYAPRARWVRTPNDSYFTAMTFPDSVPATIQPADIHDALWGILSAVYGGAIHPTAEGHAAMADAALPAARQVLRLTPAEAEITPAPLPPPQ